MGPKLAQKCSHCQLCTTEKWHTVERGVVLCSPCHEKQEKEQLELENELKEIQAEATKLESQAVADVSMITQEHPKEAEKNGGDKSQEDKKDTPPPDDMKEETTGDKDEKEADGSREKNAPSLSPRKLRKNVRSARKGGSGGTGANGGKNGRSRRFIFKKNPMKAPTITVTTRTVETLFHNNIYYQIGDIVSVMDADDDIYYAQIHGLQIDSYCEKSAYITWLIPTTSSPPPNERFDPATYLIGPEEDLPRKLSCMEFVMHAPSNYYLDRYNPFPKPDTWGPENTSQEDNSNYIWTNISHLYQT